MADRYADYDSFAWFYNRYWGDLFAGRFLAAIEQLVLSHLPSPARLLDLCCGTGQLAKVLADQGFRVTGVDGSAAMLEFARANAPGGEFVLADARSFTLPGTFHAVLSTFDSLNHVMLLPELTEVFRRVHAVLVEGGRFLFDLNMEEGYRARWRGSEAIVDDDNVCIVRPGYNAEEKVGWNEITMFRREGGTWRRADLTLRQRSYTEAEVRSTLAEAGFFDIATFDAERDLGLARNVGRMFFLVRKEMRH